MVQGSVTKKPCRHSESTGGQDVVDEGLLSLEGFRCGAARQRTFTLGRIHDRGEEFGNGAQALLGTAVDIVERLAENELTVARIIPDIEPIPNLAPRTGLAVEGLMHLAPCRPRTDAADDEVYRAVKVAAVRKRPSFFREEFLMRVPAKVMEEIDAVDEDSGLILPDIRCTKRLAHAVGW